MQRTIKEALIWASSYLKKSRIENPYFESQLLLKYLLNTTLTKLTINEEQKLSLEEFTNYKHWVVRRGAGYPFAYIVNRKQFMGLDFYVDERVLIPRPETEILVEWAMSYAELQNRRLEIVDVGTGSGTIALSLAKLLKTPVSATEISPDSIQVCKKNIKNLDLKSLVTLYGGTLLEPIKNMGLKVDLILSNLPYIPQCEYEGLQREVKDHEPFGALIGGESGLELYMELIEQLRGTLKDGGAIAIEIAYNQGPDALNLLKKGGFEKVYLLKDLAGHPRVVVGEGYVT